MQDTATRPVPTWFWVVSAAILLWELIGCYAYLTQVAMSAADMAALPEAQRKIWAAMPSWVTGAYAVAVWAGLAGAIGLLLRRRWARLALILSMLAALVQFGWTFLATDILRSAGSGSTILPLVIIVLGVAAIWFAAASARRGWLR